MKVFQFLYLVCSSLLIMAQPNMDHFYPIDAGHSYLEFSVKYMGYAKVKGQFETFSGMIYYNPEDITQTSATIDVQVASIDSDGEWRDKDLKSPNWFDAEQYPRMTFVSKSVSITDQGFDISGNLTIKGISQEVVFQMNKPSGVLKDTRGDLQVIFSGNTRIDRTDFGIEGKRWSAVKEGIAAVGNQVEIEISVLGKRFQERNISNFVGDSSRPPGRINEAYLKGGISSALKAFDDMLQEEENINERTLNLVGHYLVVQDKLDDALLLFEKNAESFPDKYNVYVSLGEAYMRTGQEEKAKASYEKSLSLNPHASTAKEVIRHLQ